jgi:predicted nuclease of predicted toxin-antitoxin system
VRFKIDENLPIETVELLHAAGYDALTVFDQALGGESDRRIIDVCESEQRVLVTNDLDFSDVRSYPPQRHHGLIVLRLHRQDKNYVLDILQRVIPSFKKESVAQRLWIVEENRVRIRGGGD